MYYSKKLSNVTNRNKSGKISHDYDRHGMVVPDMHQEAKPVYQEDYGAEPKQAQVHAAPFRSLHVPP